MIPIVEFEKRSNEGPIVSSGDFDDLLMDTAMELVDKYDLNLDEDEIIADNERADAVFEAAVEFLAEVGVWNRSTSRIIHWTEEEIREMADDYKNNPRTLTIGAGAEQHNITYRQAGDGKIPVILAGGGPLFNKDLIMPAVAAYTKEPYIIGFTKCGCVAAVGGIPAQADNPSEIYVQLEETKAQLEAARKVGRPGLFFGNINSTDPVSAALCVRPGLYEPTQCTIGVHIAPEQKIDTGRFKSALICQELGVNPWASAMSMMGGLAGGPGGAAMCVTANLLAELSYSHSPWSSIVVTDMSGSAQNKRPLISNSAAMRAAERHLSLVTGTPCTDSSEITCFEEGILSGVLSAVTCTASGAAINWLTGTTPLSARIQQAAMEAVAPMSREDVNKIVLSLLDLKAQLRKEHEGNKVPLPAQLFFSTYDIPTLSPKPEYVAVSENAVKLMREAGLPISNDLKFD